VSDEPLQLVDEEGRPAGTAARRLCHGNPELIQAVVHLFVFDPQGRLYLQRRAAAKDVFPGRWDTSVGGHLAPGESPEQGVRREAREELGLSPRRLQALPPYLFRGDYESEYVFPFRAVFAGRPRPDPEEILEGRFRSPRGIRRRIRRRPEQFTPHFRIAFARLEAEGAAE